MRPHKLLSACCLLLLAPLSCPAFGAQSVADAPHEAKEKKQKKAATQPQSAIRKSKVITNVPINVQWFSMQTPAQTTSSMTSRISGNGVVNDGDTSVIPLHPLEEGTVDRRMDVETTLYRASRLVA